MTDVQHPTERFGDTTAVSDLTITPGLRANHLPPAGDIRNGART